MFNVPDGELCVLLEEEYGYRLHLWFPKMTQDELVAWWKAQQNMDVHYLNPASSLPGQVVTMNTDDDFNDWSAMENSGKFCFAHIFDNCDSRLVTPDGVSHHHKGHDPHLYDTKPGDRAAWFDGGVWHHGHYDNNLNIIDDGTDKPGVDEVLGTVAVKDDKDE